MIFRNITDIKKDILDKIDKYLSDYNNVIDTKHIVSLLKTYLYELKIRKEIEAYQTNMIKTNNTSLFVEITKDDNIETFLINVDTELRKLKIKKINNNTAYIFKS